MSTRTIIEINHDYLRELTPEVVAELQMVLASGGTNTDWNPASFPHAGNPHPRPAAPLQLTDRDHRRLQGARRMNRGPAQMDRAEFEAWLMAKDNPTNGALDACLAADLWAAWRAATAFAYHDGWAAAVKDIHDRALIGRAEGAG